MNESELKDLMEAALRQAPEPEKGLPDPIFAFALRITPMINVDLLIRDDHGRNLLAWRDDDFGQGWHIPGGIIRFNEPIRERIRHTALKELGVEVRSGTSPESIREFFLGRGHFISLLYRCWLASPEWDASRFISGDQRPENGSLGWINGAPPRLYPAHEAYRDVLQNG